MKMTSRLFTKFIGVTLITILAVTAGAAPITIYYDEFQGDAEDGLPGEAPMTRPDEETWSGSTRWRADGSFGVTTSGNAHMYLPFVPEAGWEYTLEVNLTSATQTRFHVGLVPLDSSGNPQEDNSIQFRNSGTADIVYAWGDDGRETLEDPISSLENRTATIVLNTQNPAWTIAFSLDGDEKYSGTYTTNPTINYVTFGVRLYDVDGGRQSNDLPAIHSFSLTAIPEPGAVLLMGVGAALLAIHRRRAR